MNDIEVISYSQARSQLKSVCDQVCESHIPARITRKGDDVILLGISDWESIQETMYLMSISGATQRITTADNYRTLEKIDKQSLTALISSD